MTIEQADQFINIVAIAFIVIALPLSIWATIVGCKHTPRFPKK